MPITIASALAKARVVGAQRSAEHLYDFARWCIWQADRSLNEATRNRWLENAHSTQIEAAQLSLQARNLAGVAE